MGQSAWRSGRVRWSCDVAMQGPCVKNQDALAHSRLWDAISGFIHVFAVLQRKLYKDTSQMELLRELLGLQEEMFILLLSMLEGNLARCLVTCCLVTWTGGHVTWAGGHVTWTCGHVTLSNCRQYYVQYHRKTDGGYADRVCSPH